jgi:hypothetical protein
MVPSWARRRPLLAGFGAGILTAAVIAGVSFEAVQPSGPPRGQYASLPKQPCAMISSAELAKYLPEATGTPEHIPTGGSVRVRQPAQCLHADQAIDPGQVRVGRHRRQAADLGRFRRTPDQWLRLDLRQCRNPAERHHLRRP